MKRNSKGIDRAIFSVMMFFSLQAGFAVADDVIRINFQEAGHPQPLRTGLVHLEDIGESYGDRGNGYRYGWSGNNVDNGRRRYETGDCRLDGHVRMSGDDWEIELDDGSYRVNIGFGDPDNTDVQDFKIEGVSYNDPDGSDNFDIYENLLVNVSGGELKVEDLSGDPKLCYIEIVDAATGFPAKQTFPAEDSSVLAFPTAEGSAKHLTGGRGGDVYHVTNLDWEGPGSLQEGFLTTYDNHPRTIVFDVSGTIGCTHPESIYGDINGCYGADGSMDFNGNNITVAGQSAPGKGITIRDHTVKMKGSSNIILRYFRIRLGDENKGEVAGPDGFTSEDNDGLFLDHVSMSWTIDGIWDSRRCGKLSVQWCAFAEPLDDSLHEKGEHGYLMSFRDISHHTSIHHNLFSSGSTRHPTLGSNGYDDANWMVCDFRNNVDYNWGGGACRIGSSYQNMINNYFRFGPNGFGNGKMLNVQWHMPYPWGYLSGNFWDSISSRDTSDCALFTADNYEAIYYSDYGEPEDPAERHEFEASSEFTFPDYDPPVTESPADAFDAVIEHAGCSLVRDNVDVRIMNNVVNSTGNMIDSQDDVGGWDNYASETRPEGFDTDRDGMPDTWESRRGLDPSDPDDRNGDGDGDGYTNLEEYLNSIVESAVVVEIEATDSSSYEIGDDNMSFTVKRKGNIDGYLPVYFTLGGEADYRQDYTVSSSLIVYSGNNAYIIIPAGQSEVSFTVYPINDFVFEGSESIEITVVPDLSDNYMLGDPILATGYIYDVSGTDLSDFAMLSQFWQSSCGADSDCQSVDFDSSGSLGFVDLQNFALRWLSEKAILLDPVLINFQPFGSTVPAGSLMDAGYAYGDRGNGYTYGWDEDISDDARDRGEHSDQRYDTLNHFEKSGTHYWELEIPNGDYTVKLVMGDSEYPDSINDVQIEDVLLYDPDGEDHFDEYLDVDVTVTDGRLTVTQQSSGDGAKICFIEIR